MYGKRVLFCSLPYIRLGSVRYFKDGSSKKLLEFLADMPKPNPRRIAEAQRQRVNIQKKSEKYGASTVYLQVLGSGATGVPNTLYLFTDQKRYLFNCGECTQRLAHEHKVKLSRLEHIFVTSKTWRNIGGLPGLSLTLQDVGVPNITLHGPEGLDELYNATRRFVIMKDMNITKATCNSSADFKDSVMTVKYILLSPEADFLIRDPAAKRPKLSSSPDREFQEFMHDETDYYNREIKNPLPKKPGSGTTHKHRESSLVRGRIEKSEKVLQELQRLNNCTVAYVCTLNKRLGTLDLAKCVERGVKPGPLLGQLKSGMDVVLPDGSLVRSKDVKTPDEIGPMFIVLEVPELSYLKELEFESHFAGNPPERIPAVVVHYTPPHVLNDPRYNAFMTRFGPTTQHLVLNSQNSCLGSEAVHRTQHKLHLLDPDIFPLLRDVSVPATWNGSVAEARPGSPLLVKGLEELKKKIALAQFQSIVTMEGCPPQPRAAPPAPPAPEPGSAEAAPRVETIAGRTLTMFHLRPNVLLDRSAEPKLHIQDYIQETMDVDGFADSLERFRRVVDEMRYARHGTEAEYPKLVFLGTGSCIPSKTRNTSAIVLHIDENNSMLLDCGEGTYGQLVRFYGPKRVNTFMRTLKAIYVSHLHADHHIGLIGVLQARARAMEDISDAAPPPPVYLLAPGQIMSWLSVYDQQFEPILNCMTLVPNQGLLHEAPTQPNALTPAILAAIGLRDVKTCLVSHCPNAFGVALSVGDRHKVTYSGDTIPCQELVEIGQNSTLLIHEATMEDELADEARTKMHSTTSQAIAQGELMSAQYTVLTHFSQRYARLPRLSSHILTDNRTVGIAFDNMQITFPDLDILPLMYAPLQLMFAEHCVGMEAKAAARGRRRARTPELLPALSDKKSPSRLRRSSVSHVPQTYIETHASKLRQQMRGMPVSGRERMRSVSRTPVRQHSPERAESISIHTTRRETLGFCSVSATPCGRSPAAPNGPEVKDRSAKKMITTNSNPLVTTDLRGTHVTDSQSKTLNTVVDSPCKQRTEVKASKIPAPIKKNIDFSQPVRPTAAHGRGYVYTRERERVASRSSSYSRERCRETAVDSNHRVEVNTVTATKCIDYGSRSTRGVRLSSNMKMEIVNPMWNRPRMAKPFVKQPKSEENSPTRGAYLFDVDTLGRRNTNATRAVRNTNATSNSAVRNTDATMNSAVRNTDATRNSAVRTARNAVGPKDSGNKFKAKKAVKPVYHFEQDETLSQSPFTRPIPAYNNFYNHSIKSFKPQLEDIQSSNLLLNGKLDDVKHKDERKYKPTIDETERKQLLLETKKKFISKDFREDSRYEKIEGLNWISWK